VHRLPAELVTLPAPEAARIVAVALLAQADAAADRLDAGDDAEALHDLRVGLRRLRSHLRAHRGPLDGALKRKHEKRLARLARMTNGARDAEVQLAFLAELRPSLGARCAAGLQLLRERLERRRAVDAALPARYRRASRKLARRLADPTLREGPPLGAVLADRLHEHQRALGRALARVHDAEDQARIHRARIAAKRLRYLLEPLRDDAHADASHAVKSLRRLQEVLGDLHDGHVLAGHVAEALADVEAERSRRLVRALLTSKAAVRAALRHGPRPGLLAIAGAMRARRDERWARLEQWRAGGMAGLAREVERICGALRDAPSRPPAPSDGAAPALAS
jgi:CHAD domain-containing protein